MMGNCIICHNFIINKSEEHVIPVFIGGRAKVYSLCECCNKSLGDKVDCLLEKEDIITLCCCLYKIKNRDNKCKNIFSSFSYYDANGQKIIIKQGYFGDRQINYDGTECPEIKINNQQLTFRGSDITSIIKKVKRECKKRDLIIDEQRIEELILTNANYHKSVTKGYHDIIFDANNYYFSVLKIAFELVIDMFGEVTILDPYIEKIRMELYNCLYNQTQVNFNIDVEYYLQLDLPPKNRHKVNFCLIDNELYVIISFFYKVTFKVKVSDNASWYDAKIVENSTIIKQLNLPII